MTHLSDEAVAAHADGLLSGLARERARRHVDACSDCARAVRIQREAALRLRTAPVPALPTDLLARLRAVPISTPLSGPPTVIGPDGTPMFPAYGTPVPPTATPAGYGLPRGGFAPMAALVASGSPRARTEQSHASLGGRVRPVVRAAVAVAAIGAVAVASSAPASGAGHHPQFSSVQHSGR